MHAFGRSAAVLFVLLAAACSQVTADITRTSSLSADSKGKTFAVVPLSGQRGTQEFETYSAEVTQRLRAEGLVPTGDPAKADYAVFLRYGVTRGSTLYASTNTLFPASTRNPLATRLDTQAIRSDSKNQTNLAPITDAVGQPAPNARHLFNRSMEIDLVDTRRSTPDRLATVYSGKASTVGQHEDLEPIGKCLIDAILDGFPAGGETTASFQSETCEK
jgi:hypothetical protein